MRTSVTRTKVNEIHAFILVGSVDLAFGNQDGSIHPLNKDVAAFPKPLFKAIFIALVVSVGKGYVCADYRRCRDMGCFLFASAAHSCASLGFRSTSIQLLYFAFGRIISLDVQRHRR